MEQRLGRLVRKHSADVVGVIPVVGNAGGDPGGHNWLSEVRGY